MMRSTVSLPRGWVLPALLFLIAFCVIPLYRGIDPRNLDDYRKLFTDTFYLGVLAQTFVLSAVVAMICVVFGYPIAYFMVRHAGRYGNLIVFLLISPLLTSAIMRTFGWRIILARRGLINVALMDWGIIAKPIEFMPGVGVAIVGLVHVLIPYAVLAITASLQGVDRRLNESAELLGANGWQRLRWITVPLTVEGIGTALILVFMLANGNFVTLLLLGAGVQTLPLLIYEQFNITRDFDFARAMSNVLLVAALICLFLQLRFIRTRHVEAR